MDCPEGDDEFQSLCNNLTCHHMFKCVYGHHCLHPDKVCDGYKDCFDDTYQGEDEAVCGFGTCPPDCYCNAYALSCISNISCNSVNFHQKSSTLILKIFRGYA